jgi:hypothetical protein
MNRNTDPNDNPRTLKILFYGLSFLAAAAFVALMVALIIILRDK